MVIMTKKVIQSLKDSDVPHLYLLNVGLAQDEYNDTAKMSSEEKQKLANKIIDMASHEETLRIINDLMALELFIESSDPIRTGNRLIGQLILAYITKLDQDNFLHFYDEEVKGKNKTLADYMIPDPVKQIWMVIKNAAEKYFTETKKEEDYRGFLGKGFRIMPLFYYQQQFPEITPEQFMKGVRPIELTKASKETIDAFHKNLATGATVPEPVENKDLMIRLEQLKAHILVTEWKVGNYFLFKGGVMHGDKRLPHRVNDILNLIEEVESNKLQPKAAYAQIIEKAKEAIDNPRTGRASQTTDFYQDIYSHHILHESYLLNNSELSTSVYSKLL